MVGWCYYQVLLLLLRVILVLLVGSAGLGLTHTDEAVEDLAEHVLGHVAKVHVLVVGGEVLHQEPQSGVVGLLREQGLPHLRAELFEALPLPHLPQARREVEDERLEEQQDDHPLVVAQVFPLRLTPDLGTHSLGNGHGPGIGLIVVRQPAQAGSWSGPESRPGPARGLCGG